MVGVHHTSVDRPLPRGPSDDTTDGNSSALPMVTTFGLEILLRRLRPERREIRRDHIAGDDLGAGLLELREICEVKSLFISW